MGCRYAGLFEGCIKKPKQLIWPHCKTLIQTRRSERIANFLVILKEVFMAWACTRANILQTDP